MGSEKEVFTLPIGPAEISAQWYARSRLAVNNLGIVVWGAGQKAQSYYSVLSRVMEKTSEYTVAAFAYVCARLNLAETDQVVVWTDVGTHFRSYKVLASLAIHILQEYGLPVIQNYGAESHMKNLADGRFAHQTMCKDRCALTRELNSISDCVDMWQGDFEERRSFSDDIGDEQYLEFFPPPKVEVPVFQFTDKGRANIAIKTCHSWEFTLKDKRRKNIFGLPPNDNVLTNVIACARMLPGRRSPDDTKFMPIIKRAGEVEPGVDAEPELEDDGEGRLKLHTKFLDGWKCSYKLDAPEKKPYRTQRAKLQAKLKVLQRMFEGSFARRRPVEERAANSKRTYDKAKARRLKINRAIQKRRL